MNEINANQNTVKFTVMFTVIFLLPKNFLISFEKCLTPKLSKHVNFHHSYTKLSNKF